MPRVAKIRANTGDNIASCRNWRASASSPASSRQRRPEKLRATPKGAASSLASAMAPMARLDPTHRAGGRTHHHAFGGDIVAIAAHPMQHRAVGNAGGGEHHIARDK